MKWLAIMVLGCSALLGSLAWRLAGIAGPQTPTRQAAIRTPVNSGERKSRLEFEPMAPLIPVGSDATVGHSADSNEPKPPPPRYPADSTIHWAADARTRDNAPPHEPHARENSSPRSSVAVAQFDDELARLTEQVEIEPDNLDLRFQLATLQMRLRLWALAIQELEPVVAARPHDLASRFNLAIACQAAGRLAAARAHWDQVLAIAPDHVEARAYRGEVLLDLSAWDAAASDFAAVSQARPDDAGVALNRAFALQSAGRLQDAATCLDELLARHPRNVAALVRASRLALSRAASGEGDPQTLRAMAESFARRAAEVAPRDADVIEVLACANSLNP